MSQRYLRQQIALAAYGRVVGTTPFAQSVRGGRTLADHLRLSASRLADLSAGRTPDPAALASQIDALPDAQAWLAEAARAVRPEWPSDVQRLRELLRVLDGAWGRERIWA